MKTVLVTGANGQLGNSIRVRINRYPNYKFLFTDLDALDICDNEAVRKFVVDNEVRYILNCAAYTAVDKAEENEALCAHVNCDAVLNLAEAASSVGAKVIHVSTDYVFDGTHCSPYVEEDMPCPVSVYGRTKLAGERALLDRCPGAVIVRTAWLYSEYGNNFMKTMLRLANERNELRVVFDQVGTPTYAGDLAVAMLSILEQLEAGRSVSGIYHFTDEGVCSWYDFAVTILRMAGKRTRVFPIESKDYPTLAVRPHYSVLNKKKIKDTFGLTIPHWEDSLAVCMRNIVDNNI